ncbi:YihY/virulence factor BrkB family protein [Nocardioides hwasunensis]|uniref:YihY/virulence factor BrkB family protein n=1 Tax=Nocardioides hwasunensis TaxID=397258 RepID=A0ABR8MDH0_9ACTN|nr:YihY/virulence factor BrkB family protein [Nocardioides hwasunensis]MBD3914169.1 YihY/virulence factor BrkB family protein [Nocardioides hwasunensis]
MSLVSGIKQRIADLRERRPFVDHVFRMIEHYGNVNGNALAAAVTYFAFLSFFPILALSFAIFGLVAKVYPDAQDTLVDAANSVLPGLVGPPNGVSLDTLQSAAPGIFSVGILLTLYSGLGWLSGMRQALVAVFEEPEREQPGFVPGKIRDILAMLALGSVLMLSVAVSGVATKLLSPILDALGLGLVAGVFLAVLAIVLGLAANTLLFFAFFRLLAQPEIPSRSLWQGALLGAVVFELLKQASTFLLKSTANSEAFQAFGIALILLVWINYFSRVVVYAAAFAYTSREARAIREARTIAEQTVEGPQIDLAAAAAVVPSSASASAASTTSPQAAFAAGAASMLGLVALLRRRR